MTCSPRKYEACLKTCGFAYFILLPGGRIHSKSEIVYSSGQKDWQKKYRNGDNKKLLQEYVNNEIYGKMAYLIKNMILVCVYLRFKQLLNSIGKK